MEHYAVTFRFDNNENTLSKYNGLSISDLSKFLKALSNALNDSKSETLVLSEIKGNCYAPVISTTSVIQFESIKTLHTEIEKNKINNLTKAELEYVKTLKGLISKDLILNVYDESKEFYKTIDDISEEPAFPFFYETASFRGILTRIGSSNVDSKITIEISSFTGIIEIDNKQDLELSQYYKKGFLEFYVTQKINNLTNKIENTVLDDFKVLHLENEPDLILQLLDVREKFGPYFGTLSFEDNE